VTRTPLSRSKGQGHQPALLSVALTCEAGAAVTVRRIGRGNYCYVASARRRARRWGAHGGRRRAGHIVSPRTQLVTQASKYSRLTSGWATLPQGNHDPLVAKAGLEDPRWAWGKQVHEIWYFFTSVLWHCWLGDRQQRHPACKELGVGLLVVTIWLEFCSSYEWMNTFIKIL